MRYLLPALCLMACTIMAQNAPAPKADAKAAAAKPTLTPPKRVRRVPEFAVRRLPGSTFQIIDARAKPASGLQSVASQLERFCDIPFQIVSQPATGQSGLALARAALARPQDVGAVVVVAEEGPEAPRLALYPEDRCGVINASRLADGADAKTADARLAKELWRTVAFIAGGVNSDEPCVVKTVLSSADLDTLPASTFSPNVAGKISQAAKRLGLARIERTSYRAACLQGWAPPPTNAAQKAIWESVNPR